MQQGKPAHPDKDELLRLTWPDDGVLVQRARVDARMGTYRRCSAVVVDEVTHIHNVCVMKFEAHQRKRIKKGRK